MYDLTSYNLGEKIKNIRKSKGITLEALGDMIGKSKSTMYKYEANAILPDFITILEICNALQINTNELCDFENFLNDNQKSVNPFKTDKLYLYYIGFKSKLVVSSITIKNINGIQKVIFKNTIKNKTVDASAFLYEGSLESDNIVAFINLKNDGISNKKFEKVQIIINLNYSHDNKYIGSINATTDSNKPTTRKCMITTDLLIDKDELNECFETLKLTEEDIENIKKDNFWNMETNNINEYSVEV